MRLLAFVLGSVLVAACAPQPVHESPAVDEELLQLADWMSGHFENVARGGADGEAPPRKMTVIPFGDAAGPADERWIYVAQWSAGGDVPARRFVYRLHRTGPEMIIADLHSIVDRQRLPVVPEQAELDALDRKTDLRRRSGCRIWLSRDGLSYSGGTRGYDCASRYRDASRIRIELVVRENEMVEWLQGFDAQGQRLWGGDAGARVFRRME